MAAAPELTHVYVMASEGGMCKIGIAKDPATRLGNLKTGHPYKLMVAHAFSVPSSLALQIERAAHKILAAKRMVGEWFQVAEDEAASAVLAAIEAPDTSPISIPEMLCGSKDWKAVDGPIRPSQFAIDELGEDVAQRIIDICLWALGEGPNPDDKPMALKVKAIAREGLE